jgi:hypothetical protein
VAQTGEISERLILAPAPVEGESLLGYCERIAAVYEVATRQVLEHLGLPTIGNRPSKHQRFGVALNPDERMTLVARLPVTDAFLALAVLTGYNNRGVNFNPGAMVDPSRTGPAVTYGWVLGTRSNACPRCLHDYGIWPTRWRLLWSAACSRHRLGLIDRCPDCTSPMMALRSRLDLVPGVTKCHCGCDLGRADTATASSAMFETQLVLDAAMEGQFVTLAGDRLDSHTFFAVFRTLADLIRATGYDLEGDRWAEPQPLKDHRISEHSIAAVRAIVERTGRILTLTAQQGQASVDTLRRRAEQQSIQVVWRFKRYGLEPSRIGCIGKALSE